jgi:hypothetical protein
MPSPVNGIVHLCCNVEAAPREINALCAWVRAQQSSLAEQLLEVLLLSLQREWLEQVRGGTAEWVCTRCGLVHQDASRWRLRGRRLRQWLCSSGPVRLPLLQLECRACGARTTPLAERLGLQARQRRSAEVERLALERVTELSYRKSVRTLFECGGIPMAPSTLHALVQQHAVRLSLQPDPTAAVLLVDGTKVRAGGRAEFEDLRLSFQVQGRAGSGARPAAKLRLVGLAVGRGSWPAVLPGDATTQVVVTDAEAGVEAHVRERYPQARHQFCLWHVVYALAYSLRQDGVAAPRRRQLQQRLQRILWGSHRRRSRAERYRRFVRRLACHPTAQRQLARAAPHVLFESASAEQTTSLIERQMREVDRRVWNGARWSERGVENLMRLAFARVHNSDDYQRLWN